MHAQLVDVRLHDLRHSFASDALNAGVALAVVGNMLGHKAVETSTSPIALDPERGKVFQRYPRPPGSGGRTVIDGRSRAPLRGRR